jgi:hypothetical protein
VTLGAALGTGERPPPLPPSGSAPADPASITRNTMNRCACRLTLLPTALSMWGGYGGGVEGLWREKMGFVEEKR